MNIINNQFKDYSTLNQQREFVDKLYRELCYVGILPITMS